MIRKITFSALMLFASLSFAQLGPVGHLTIFSEDGDKFTLILNGEVINDVPQTNLRVEDLNQPYYNAKIKFEDKSLMDISKNNLMLTDVDGIFADVTYKIKRDKNNKTKMKLNYFSSIPVRPDFIPPSNVHVIHYGQPRPVQVVAPVQQPVRGVTQATTTTTTQTGGTAVGVGVNVGGVNMGISINDNMGGGAVTQTTTTTTTVGGGHVVETVEPVRGCNGRSCMTAGNFNAALATIKKQSFEDTQLKTAKQVIAANCLNVDQIIQIANTFSFEDNKLEFAKFAYDYCIEPRNYFKLNGIFSFSSNVDELSDYVQSRQ
ncbi:MAG: hypothetical protein C0525_11215 [Flavobacterium sp.]|uniref:DUF4476 domain-containing protein n=1 Tax=Flavobacterium sp. TaxID=239 RepID=UPI0025C283C1|nr:DUF4476 domain-containing protein [Flavobacterium sp.]MBA4135284.1 hypothetical protein [Flavobacterium sp.]